MESVAARFSSPRFQRYMLWVGVAVFVIGAIVLTFTLFKGSDGQEAQPDKGFHPKLPAKSIPLRNSDGVTVKTYQQLDPQIRQDVRTFIATAVARKHLGDSWDVVSPSLRAGYTKASWTKGDALPVVPYPGVDPKHVEFFLDYASTKEILLEVGLAGKPGVATRPVTFQLGLSPTGAKASHRWAVDYWMPRWTPPVPQN
jgi:hypothetical protein